MKARDLAIFVAAHGLMFAQMIAFGNFHKSDDSLVEMTGSHFPGDFFPRFFFGPSMK